MQYPPPPYGAAPPRPAPPPPIARRPRDDLQTPFWTLLAVGAVSAMLLVLGLSNLLMASMPWAHTGLHVKVDGVYSYDPSARSAGGDAHTSFSYGQPFAAKVEWGTLPSSLEVGGEWYDSNQQPEGGLQPDTAGDLASHQAVVPMANRQLPPGRYSVLVMHYVDGKPIEILGRTSVRVVR